MAVKDILHLGNPDLYEVSTPVEESELESIPSIISDLHDTLMDFRTRYGVGRAIAAPQIGIAKRIIYLNEDEPTVFINPELVDLSPEMIELWDDCMSFPELLVRVSRHRTCRINYFDMNWNPQSMELEDDLSELLQHEYDHLNGILAVDRAEDKRSFCYRCNPEEYRS
ncbi:MAG: peptide deformylase [Candidatus Thorarchaeota archaeon]|jgi:peptide deformylase